MSERERAFVPEAAKESRDSVLREDSPEYGRMRDEALASYGHNSYGSSFLNERDEWERRIAQAEEMKKARPEDQEWIARWDGKGAEAQKEMNEFLAGENRHFQALIKKLATTLEKNSLAGKYLDEYLFARDNETTELLQEFGFTKTEGTMAAVQFAQALRTASPEACIKFLRWHQRKFESLRERMQVEGESIKQDYLQMLEGAIQAGWLPVEREVAARRISETHVDLLDPLLVNVSGKADLWQISVSAGIKNDEVRHAVFHELTHVIGARELRMTSPQGFKKVSQSRSGLRLSKYDVQGNEVSAKHLAINEAVVETLALKLMGLEGDGSGDYPVERASYGLFLKKHPDAAQLILEAYCGSGQADEAMARFLSYTDWDKEIQGLSSQLNMGQSEFKQ